MNELNQQVNECNIHFDDIIMACGSGATTAGIALGCHLSNNDTKVHAYSVCDSPEYFYNFIDKELYDPLFSTSLIEQPKAKDIVRIIDGKRNG